MFSFAACLEQIEGPLSLKVLSAGFMFFASPSPFLADLIMREKCAVSGF